jgi:hypothetical protein
MKFTDLTVGTHTVIIGYDILKGTKHALDYLGTYNATETTAYACAGIAGCTGAPTTFPVPTDTVTVTSNINPNTGLPIAQIPGVFSMWGGTITSASYVAYAGGEERQISITFTADVPNPVIAWGGHIAWIGDWGAGNSAVAISGSPYHMRLIELDGSGGNQDRALQNTAVIPSAAVFVKKEVFTAPPDPTNGAFTTFNFTATANFGMTSFGLVDDNEGPGVDTAGSQPIVQFGAENMITVSEIQQSGWTFLNVNCAETGLQDSTKNSVTPTANIIVQVGEIVTCTFQNSQLVPTAANASISGRVLLRDGTGLYGVVVLLTCPATGVNYAARTNPFGFYQFSEIPTGHAYFVIAKAKGKSFVSSVQSFTLSEDLTDVNLYLDPLE